MFESLFQIAGEALAIAALSANGAAQNPQVPINTLTDLEAAPPGCPLPNCFYLRRCSSNASGLHGRSPVRILGSPANRGVQTLSTDGNVGGLCTRADGLIFGRHRMSK